MQFSFTLTAGVPIRQETAGAYFLILDTGAAAAVAVSLLRGSETLEKVSNAARGFKARMAPGAGRFDRVELLSSVNAVVECVISDGMVDINAADGSTVHVADLPLPVQTEQGDGPGNPLFVSGITYDDTPAVSVDELTPVAATDVAATLLAADINRKAFRVLNLGPDDVAIGGAGLTWANRVIVLANGLGWFEDDGAAVAWKCICETGNNATVNVQEVLL